MTGWIDRLAQSLGVDVPALKAIAAGEIEVDGIVGPRPGGGRWFIPTLRDWTERLDQSLIESEQAESEQGADLARRLSHDPVVVGDVEPGPVVYRHFASDGELLYIGMTERFHSRQQAHRYRSGWWCEIATITAARFGTPSIAREVEAHAIRTESPVFNRRTW